MEVQTLPRRHSSDIASRRERDGLRLIIAGRVGAELSDDGPSGPRFLTACFRSSLVLPLHVPVLLLAVLTIVFRISDADIEICRWFYQSAGNTWRGAHPQLLRLLYDYGPMPALGMGIGGLAVGVLGLFWRRLRPYRKAGFFLAAMLALGPGLIVNGVFKPYWQRPRPLQTLAFGGNEPFLPVWELGASPHSKSFPSGHASMGFYLLAPAFLCCRRRRRLAMMFVAVGLTGGLLIGAGRVMQGAHYPSDVVWSAGMVYLSGLVLLGIFELVRSAGERADGPADRSLEPSVVRRRLPGPERGRATNPAVAERTRRAA